MDGGLVDHGERRYGIEIGFLGWLKIGLPILIVFLPLAWLCLVKLVFPCPGEPVSGARALIQEELRALGPPSRGPRPDSHTGVAARRYFEARHSNVGFSPMFRCWSAARAMHVTRGAYADALNLWAGGPAAGRPR